MIKKPNEETSKKLLSMKRCRYDKTGREILNPKPKLALFGPAKPLSDIEKMQRMTHENMLISEMEKYTETWQEHNDFSIDSDIDEEFFNTQFTLCEDEIPDNLHEPSEEAMKAADTFSKLADDIETGKIDPNTINMDFLKKPEEDIKSPESDAE